MRKLFYFLAVLLLLFAIVQTYHLIPVVRFSSTTPQSEKQTVVYEESVVTKVVEDALPSVVTIGIVKTTTSGGYVEIDPFNFINPFRQVPGTEKKIDQNIGSGFIVSTDGLIITNKHVVSDTEASYKVLTNNNKQYTVEKIYRDSSNDLAILKINANGLKALTLGDSSKLKLGQMAIAIGTPLGEFKNTVTTGIVSGLGRGITAGSVYEGYVEKLDNVIQTDAAISAGNSGGPLLNSKGQVIGVNTAIAQGGQNIGFALPVNLVKALLSDFQKRGGSFEKAYLGIRFQMINRQKALMNELPEGAYVEEVVEGSPAAKAGITADDVITFFDGKRVRDIDKQDLATYISEKKPGDKVKITYWRNKKEKEVSITLTSQQ